MDQPKSQVTGSLFAFLLAMLLSGLVIAVSVSPNTARAESRSGGNSPSSVSNIPPNFNVPSTSSPNALPTGNNTAKLDNGPHVKPRMPIQPRVPIKPRT